jgi:hypothetical protein
VFSSLGISLTQAARANASATNSAPFNAQFK